MNDPITPHGYDNQMKKGLIKRSKIDCINNIANEEYGRLTEFVRNNIENSIKPLAVDRLRV